MNILIVVSLAEVGGAQTFAIRLANELAKDTNNSIFFCDLLDEYRDPRLLKLLSKNVHYIDIKINRLTGFLIWKINDLLNLLGYKKNIKPLLLFKVRNCLLKKNFKKYNIELINSHLALADEHVTTASGKIPVVVSMHGCYESLMKGGYDNSTHKGTLDEIFLKTADVIFTKSKAIVYVTQKNLDIFNHLPSYPLLIKKQIYYGFQKPQYISPVVNSKFTFGIVSRADHHKGWEQAILAFIELHKKHKNISLVLVGDSPYKQNLMEKYKQYEDIIFAGFTTDSINWIKTFSIGLLPTYLPAESLPNSIIEYLSCNKPVIATNMGEIEIMIDAGEGSKAGFIVPFDKNGKADVDQLAFYMEQYLTNPVLLKEHELLAEKAFRKFDMATCVSYYSAIFNQLIIKK